MSLLRDGAPLSNVSARVQEILDQHSALNAQTAELLHLVKGDYDWGDLDVRLAELDRALTRHFELEEDGGYMADVRVACPRVIPLVERLEQSHGDLARQLRILRHAAIDRHDRIAVRGSLLDWLDLLGRHEAAEKRLLSLEGEP